MNISYNNGNLDELENKSGIYKITCLTNGKYYIGSSANLKNRFKVHK